MPAGSRPSRNPCARSRTASTPSMRAAETPVNPAEIQDALTRADRLLARLEATRDGDRKTLEARTGAVAAAKGRLAQRDAVDTYLRELQQDANRRSVATFETLLTALVQEVLPARSRCASTSPPSAACRRWISGSSARMAGARTCWRTMAAR